MLEAMRKRKALLAEERVAAVAGAEAPDFPGFRVMDDVFLLVARPRHVLLPRGKRRADGVHAGNHALFVGVDLLVNGQADARHDPHVDHRVGRVGQLHADLRHGRTDRPHGKRQHVHRAPLHAAAKKSLERPAHLERIAPVVGRPGVALGQRADEGAVLHARHVPRVTLGVVTARPEILVELGERAARHHLRAEGVVLFLGAIDPVDRVGLEQRRHLVHPLQKVLVPGERLCVGRCRQRVF